MSYRCLIFTVHVILFPFSWQVSHACHYCILRQAHSILCNVENLVNYNDREDEAIVICFCSKLITECYSMHGQVFSSYRIC